MKVVNFGLLLVWQLMKLIPDGLQKDSATFGFIVKKMEAKKNHFSEEATRPRTYPFLPLHL